MTANDARATTLARALHARAQGDWAALEQLCTDDIRAWTPALSTASRAELVAQLDGGDDAFSDIELELVPLDVGGDYACVEWTVAMTHTGVLTLGGDTTVEPTEVRVTLHGATVAEFSGDRICSLRQYWDELELLEQLGVVG